jgi:hypothetical protein
MAGVPPFPWTEVATKRDLDTLETRLLARIDAVRGEFLARMGSQTRTVVLTNTLTVLATAALVLAAVRL